METIIIPSPSAFLSSPVQEAASIDPPPPPPQPPPARRRKSTTPKETSASDAKKPAGVIKPKQSKSRNGESPHAKSLKLLLVVKRGSGVSHIRSVTCGGYKKDFKWRPFEEATFTNKPAPPRAKTNSASTSKPASSNPVESPAPSDGSSVPSADPNLEVDADVAAQDTFFSAAVPSPSLLQLHDSNFADPFPTTFDMSTPPYLRPAPPPRIFGADSVTSSLESLFEDTHFQPATRHGSISGHSPRLMDLLLSGSEMNAEPSEPIQTHTADDSFSFQSEMISMTEEDIEEIIRQPPINSSSQMPFRAPPHTHARSRMASPRTERQDPYNRMYQQLEIQAGSPEMLMLRFDKQTCGILSVKDGPTENPWRTLIWPLAQDSPALYHAIASMTAFHSSKERPDLRVDGMEHMRQSIRQLASGIEKMPKETALATTLVLAFSESWDQHISTGIEHLRGARILVTQALTRHSRHPLVGNDLARLKFLCNTWVYMDVIARLTSIDDDEVTDFDNALSKLYGPFGNISTEVDPLMGCASTLFPLIGAAASLCRKVGSARTNSIALISQANELKEQIERWQTGTEFDDPEDPSADVQHALQTAEAYRFATLLYLHQAVPEIPSLTSAQLAKKVLVCLATVPLSSRLVIVQIYPLLAAGCEAYDVEDRQWVESRWQSMGQRMWIGNIDKCWQVTKEVWRRRDEYELAEEQRRASRTSSRLPSIAHGESSKRKLEDELTNAASLDEMFSFEEMLNGTNLFPGGHKRHRTSVSSSVRAPVMRKKSDAQSIEEMDPEMTVRGRLHWVGVMRDWEWEILLG
ncbi:MAG: hypothetical protein M1818_002530 [Claussenomyces sp. TS43310]|nr:MAG: hypothetical protein M1818_002530 [Claussenomyces sp. TS43310]